MAKVKTFVAEERWNADTDILVCQNGTLHIPSGELKEHSPEHYATSAVPYPYDPDVHPMVWQLFLRTTVPDAAKFLQEFAGYALTTDTSHETALWLAGPRGSGKSTGLLGFQTMLGNRSGVLGLSDIERNRFALANLPGKTLVIATEQPASFIRSTDVLNAIISGETIQVERKYRDAYEITPRAKIAWAMNDLPRISESSNGIFRRVKVIQFPALSEDERDPTMKAKISEEGPGLLNWALEGLQRLRERGYFNIPDCVQDATREFQKANDIPTKFIEEACVWESGARVQAGELYSEYKNWCEENGHRHMNSTRIASEWERLGLKKYPNPIKGRKYYEDIRLRLPSE
jgi:putative DNA primase/helicase